MAVLSGCQEEGPNPLLLGQDSPGVDVLSWLPLDSFW